MLILYAIKKVDSAMHFYCHLRYGALLRKAWAKNVTTIQVDADDLLVATDHIWLLVAFMG